MGEWTPRLVILGLLALVLGVPFALRPRDELSASVHERGFGGRLVIISPHNEQIRYEFSRAFNRWRATQGLAAIEFDWRSSGGTSDLRKQIIAEFQKAASKGDDDKGIGKDLFFGGGDFEHDTLARGTVIDKPDGSKQAVAITVPIHLPPGLLEEVFPEPQIGGVPLYHPKRQWVGVVLSSFGIIYNRDALKMRGLPEPTTWRDLTDGRYRSWLALADPSHSGSVAATLHTILRREGWTEGWGTLRRMAANARYFTNSAAKVPVDVSAGEAAAGMSIDFYGRFQVGAIGGSRVGYIDPPGEMTAITPDPISLLRGAPSPELAQEFIAWLLSPEGQGLWQRRLGTPNGPERYELRRLPARRDLYNDREMSFWADHVKPFDSARPFPSAMPMMFSLVAPVIQSMAIDCHEELTAAWEVIQREPAGRRREQMVVLFDAMPADLTLAWPDDEMAVGWRGMIAEAAHPRHAEAAAVLKAFISGLGEKYRGEAGGQRLLRDRQVWREFFRGNYAGITAMARE